MTVASLAEQASDAIGANSLLPRVGPHVSGHTVAYSYLPAWVGAFPPPPAFMAMLEKAGFTTVRADSLTLGIVYLYTATKG